MVKHRCLRLLPLVIALSMGCKARSAASQSAVKDLAYDGTSARNVAAFFTAPNPRVNTPVYIQNDPEDIIRALTTLDQNFTSHKHEDATRAIATTWLRAFSGSDHLSEDGTLMIYIAGHGAPSAQAQMTDGSFIGWGDIATAIRTGRNNRPIKRLVLMVFGCYSGSWINAVRAQDTSSVAEELFVITSSTSQQLSYSGGYNSQLVAAFNTVFASYGGGRGDVTLGSFARDIQRYVPQSTPQFFGQPETLLNETLFNAEVVELFNRAKARGIMPSPEDFRAGHRAPRRDTILARENQEADPETDCKFDILRNAQNIEQCSAWNKQDTSAVAANVRARPANAASRCDPALIYAGLTAEKYATLHQHCGGILKARTP